MTVGEESNVALQLNDPRQSLGLTIVLVSIASNGEEAVAIYGQKKDAISLVILDLIMPVMDGRQCLGEILRIDPGARVLTASGYSPDGTTSETLAGAAKGFVGKPYNLRGLLKTVRSVLNGE